MARPEPPDPGLPIKLDPCSNGETAPPPPSPLAREVARRTRDAADRKARRLGMSRRDFLRSSMGAATMLSILAACSRESGQTGGDFAVDRTSTTTGGGRSTTTVDGTADTPATMEPDAAEEAIGPFDEELIVDVQNHLLEYPDDSTASAPGFPQSSCGEADPRDCYGIEHFLELLFVESDTHVVMLSAIPFAPGALSPEVMERTIAAADELGCADRVLMQGESFPTSTGLDAMADVADRFPIRALKTYTHSGGPAWRLDDDTGDAYFAQVAAVGVPIVAVHKGLSGNNPASSPVDVGPAAANHPGIDILVYHSAYETGTAEGPYDLSVDVGVNRLITSVADAGLGPGGNVYAELGSTWRNLMARPDEAAHLLGKLLVAFGPDNILWGTDSIWYGSPQDQIQAFRAFEISDEFQDRFGYPALTPEIKRKILGHNAARLFDIDGPATTCEIDRDALLGRRQQRTSTFHTHAEAGARAFRLGAH